VADRVEGLREIEGYDDDIWAGLEQTSDGMEKGTLSLDFRVVWYGMMLLLA